MERSGPAFLVAALACACTAFAAAPAAPPSPAVPGPPLAAAAPAAPAPPAAPSPGELDARLQRARERLEAAAREVAALSIQAGEATGARVLFAGEIPRRAIIGVQVDPASGRDGARIAEVSPGGPAAAAGLRAGDVLQSIDGTDLRGRGDAARVLVERLHTADPGAGLGVKVLRDGVVREYEVTPRPSPPAFAGERFDVTMPRPGGLDGAGVFVGHGGFGGGDWPGEGGSVSGLELATVTPALGKYFGTSQGVLVLRAPRQETWRLQDGDVILAIDGREPTSGAHASRILRSYQAGERVKLRIMRERKALELAVAVPEADRLAGRRLRVIRMQGDGTPAGEPPGGRRLPLPQ